MLESMENKSYEEKQRAINDFMAKTMIFEVPSNVRRRAQKIKEMLQNYSNSLFVLCSWNKCFFSRIETGGIAECI